MFNLEGKVAFVTGGNGGIGLGMAKGFIEHGASVTLAARNEEKLASAVNEIADMGVADRVMSVACDVVDRDSIQAALDATVEKFGGVDIVVNNAGTNRRADEPHLLSDEAWRDVIDTNLTSMHNVTSLAFPLMKERWWQVHQHWIDDVDIWLSICACLRCKQGGCRSVHKELCRCMGEVQRPGQRHPSRLDRYRDDR